MLELVFLASARNFWSLIPYLGPSKWDGFRDFSFWDTRDTSGPRAFSYLNVLVNIEDHRTSSQFSKNELINNEKEYSKLQWWLDGT